LCCISGDATPDSEEKLHTRAAGSHLERHPKTTLPSAGADWPEPSSAQPRKVRSHDVQVRPGSFLPGLAAALFSAAGDEAALTRHEGGSALSEVYCPGAADEASQPGGRRSRGFFRLPEGRGCICRTHLPDPGSGRGLRSGVDTQRFNLCGSRALASSRAIARHRSGRARRGSPPLMCRGDFDFTVLFRAPISAGCSARYVTAPLSGGPSRSTLPWLRLLAVAGLQPLLNRCASRRVVRAFSRRLRRADSGGTSPPTLRRRSGGALGDARFLSESRAPRTPHRGAWTLRHLLGGDAWPTDRPASQRAAASGCQTTTQEE